MSRRLLTLSPWAVAALGAAVYLLVAPPSADLAAQEYRADLGLTLWNNGWFAGHHTPGYSVLFPPLGATLGVRLTGALSAVAAAALFAPLARCHWGERAGGAAALWFAAGTTAVLLTGRLTFLLGVAIGVGALLALACDRRLLAVALAATTTLASPVAGLFVALAVAAWALAAAAPDRARAWGWGAAIAAAALAPVAITLVLFPAGRHAPARRVVVLARAGDALALAALLPAQERALRTGALLYALLLVAAFVIDSPLGGNATRLGALAAGPIVLGALIGRRSPALVAALALALAYWPLYPAIRDVVRASGDPSLQAAYYAPLLRFLQSRAAPAASGSRSRSPRTTGRRAMPRAGGMDCRSRAVGSASSTAASARCSTTARSTPPRIARWLDEHAVAYVAVPDAALDAAGATRQGSSRTACRTCARSGATRTGASSRSPGRRRSRSRSARGAARAPAHPRR